MQNLNLHPIFVHFPVAFFTLGSLLVLLNLFLKSDFLTKTILLILTSGVIFSIGALITGNIASANFHSLSAPHLEPFLSKKISDTIELHEDYATYTLLNYTLMLFSLFYGFILAKRGKLVRYKLLFITVPLLLALSGLFLLYLTGIYGGELVFRYGVGGYVN